MSVVNTAVVDLLVVRDDDNAAITGLTAGSFDKLEAFLIATPATTAAVTLTEIGGGEYRASFTPTAVGAWALHYVYAAASLFDFKEEERRYDVAASLLPTPVTLTVGQGDPYLTVDDFRSRLGAASEVPDAAILSALTTASRQIDRWCGLDNQVSFGQRSAIFTFTPTDPWRLDVPDLVSVDEIATDFGQRTYPLIWEASDFDLFPIDSDRAGQPFRQIRTRPFGHHTFPAPFGGWQAAPLAIPSGTYPRETGLTKGVRITGTWGWPAVPVEIVEATFLIANRLLSLANAPFGKTGAGEMGGGLNMTTSMTPIIQALISPYRVRTV